MKVDSKGRIVLPQELRERLNITPGMEVEIREEDGVVVVEPEDDPEEILARMDELVAEASSKREEIMPVDEDADAVARKHRTAVRSGAENADDE